MEKDLELLLAPEFIIAGVLREHAEYFTYLAKDAVVIEKHNLSIIYTFATALKKLNPQLDREKFINACGIADAALVTADAVTVATRRKV